MAECDSTFVGGVALMVFQAVLSMGILILSKYMEAWAWPFFRMLGIANLLIASCIAIYLHVHGQLMPRKGQAKWIWLCGFFSCGQFALALLALRFGAPPGDIASLTSISLVLAAFLGRVLLQEPFSLAHLVALAFSIAGAALISRPSFIFGRGAVASSGISSWLGYVLAPASGLFHACNFICSRKAVHSSTLQVTASTTLTSVPVFFGLSYTGLLNDFDLDLLLTAFHPMIWWISLIFVSNSIAVFAYMKGAKMIPAAVSATVDTTSNMVLGYLAQIVLFQAVPNVLTVLGAVLMLIGAIVVILARRPRAVLTRQDATSFSKDRWADLIPSETSSEASGQASDQGVGQGNEEDDGLLYFIAEEFVGCDPAASSGLEENEGLEEDGSSLRQRRSERSAPQILGHPSVHSPTLTPAPLPRVDGVAMALTELPGVVPALA